MDPSQVAGHNDRLAPIVVIVESGPCRLLILVYAMVRATAGRPCGWRIQADRASAPGLLRIIILAQSSKVTITDICQRRSRSVASSAMRVG